VVGSATSDKMAASAVIVNGRILDKVNSANDNEVLVVDAAIR
jgi:hypothetical protein